MLYEWLLVIGAIFFVILLAIVFDPGSKEDRNN